MMTKSGRRTVEPHGRAALQPGIIRYFLRCPDFVMHSYQLPYSQAIFLNVTTLFSPLLTYNSPLPAIFQVSKRGA